ncbi:NupC/NupG family nucleoside CNT transporter [Komagataeibacter oboediens]|uniref:NupC/NupG family nucleoside CNT transporter n=1 Tax=Komagataeibacter oboediens TaxID=65958 RepID=A0A318QXZ6_9PROT|nr:nucleoside transporter C-terminal domain-containing protein [Komagataeibacter oboediens]GBR27669.1 nucleoside permease [Komagataeibacter oboediens DSM 11826]MBL7232672.1 NupC/NupG family nucleoside CNT transporter [Komagataeibacter oboediens]MBT0676056.1 NupC/NupG family nucleoside CNT transporter [Komagataeibacter oboediens]MBT0679619.1 NupC/NupG family nucleoside CNT transporter [Komagataeibacter oboediens]MBV0888759.1 NupC/NupG family nucleoside CNT transporter [Komagataeibacter oboedien
MHIRGFIGIIFLICVAMVFSTDRKRINLRIIGACLLLQAGIGLLVLRVPSGQAALRAISDMVTQVLSYGSEGARFLFGGLVGPRMHDLFPDGSYVFAFQVLPSLVYVSALIAVLYHFGIMQAFARLLGRGLQWLLGTSPVESFGAIITIFVGQSELPVALGPYLASMSTSELASVMCSGTASVSGATLVGYFGLGIPADYLVAASFMAIPGGLMFAKMLEPRAPDSPVSPIDAGRAAYHRAFFEAVMEGAMKGAQTAVAVAAMLVACIGLIALVNGMLQGIGGHVGLPALSLEYIMGLLLAPLAWMLGVPAGECDAVGSVLGLKVVLNEFVAYLRLGPDIQAGRLSARAAAIASFALCGFANLSSLGLAVAAFGSQCPDRREEIAHKSARAVLGGMLSNLMSAAIAGIIMP